LSGAFANPKKLADITVAMAPLVLCAAGMLVTFAAGLWNIGVEGQMVAGALMTTWAALAIEAPPAVMLPLTILAGLAGGALWGLLTGLLRTYGRVNEIFAGLGLNFVATALTNYLIFGPWKPPDGATMSGTDPFQPSAWMPSLGATRASWVSIALALAVLAAVFVALRNTRWGLRLKALGLNAMAAQRMGINATGNLLSAFIVCGALAGLAGSLQTTAVYHRLIPSISGGYGYLSQLVVLLSGLNAAWVAPVVFFFAAIQVGSPRLELRMQLDSSLGGVLQTSIVLFFLLVRGWRGRLEAREERDA
ncbi:MAG: ABC transporter permease, partial [Chloroflexota bacterium]